MDLVFDAGNSRIGGAVYDGDACRLRFQFDSRRGWTPDELGWLLTGLLLEHGIAGTAIQRVAVCSVVSALTGVLAEVAQHAFGVVPMLVDRHAAHGLRIAYSDPQQLGADRIANAVGALARYPQRDLIIVDAGTATTVCAVSRERAHLGGAILPGIGMAAHSLRQNTGSLPLVQVRHPPVPLGMNTVDNIAAGLYFGQMGAIRELTQRTRQAAFADAPALVVGTGGAAALFAEAGLFDAIDPDLTLFGTRLLLDLSAPI